MRRRERFIALFACLIGVSPCAAAWGATIPSIGCRSDGQLGPVAAPKRGAANLSLDKRSAAGLAFYHAKESVFVLAPRGWNCIYWYGSSGSSLVVAPASGLDDPDKGALPGPAVVYSSYFGGTSGRFEVAKYAARLFADQEKAFIESVVAEGIEPASNFPSRPYPLDLLTRKSASLVEFTTPAGRPGLGTSDRLKPSSLPVIGFVQLQRAGNEPDVVVFQARLPAAQSRLGTPIVAAAERLPPLK